MVTSLNNDKIKTAINFLHQGLYEEAFPIYQSQYSKFKNNGQLLYQYAFTAIQVGKHQQAKNIATRTIKISPNIGGAYNVLGIVALEETEYVDAISFFDQFLKYEPNNIDGYSNLARAYISVNQDEQAAELQKKACEFAPMRTDLILNYAQTLKTLGQFLHAKDRCFDVLKIDPSDAEAWRLLSTLNALSADEDLCKLEEALQNNKNPMEKAKIHFAIAGMYEKEKNIDLAFKNYDLGNGLADRYYDFDVNVMGKYIAAIKEQYQPELMKKFEGCGLDTSKIIFIVGMPRSGTTLVEQVLSGHSEVDAAGELTFLDAGLLKHGLSINREYPFCLNRWRRKDLQEVGKKYLRSVDMLKSKTKHITDKMPENFMHLGMIHSIFPNARIIHCTRNPIDTCLGNYRQLFQLNNLQLSYSQAKLVKHYKAYQLLMAHWNSLFGDKILEVKYENFVTDVENNTRALIKHCGLDWEDQCLNITDRNRAVKTVSSVQVREGIHSENIDKWRKYEKFIQPLIQGLGAGPVEVK